MTEWSPSSVLPLVKNAGTLKYNFCKLFVIKEICIVITMLLSDIYLYIPKQVLATGQSADTIDKWILLNESNRYNS